MDYNLDYSQLLIIQAFVFSFILLNGPWSDFLPACYDLTLHLFMKIQVAAYN
jgi:hypothetical protein